GDLAWAVHALHETEGGQPIPEGIGRILDPAVAVKDHARARAAMEDGAVEGREGQPRIFGRPEAPPEDSSRVTVHDDGQVPPDAGDLEEGDVAAPHLSGSRGQALELAVGNAGKEAVQPRDPTIELGCPRAQPRLAHEPSNASATHSHAGGHEGPMHPRTAIC